MRVKASGEVKGGLLFGAGCESAFGEFCVFRGCVQSGARVTPARRVRGLRNRGQVGPGEMPHLCR